MLKRNPFVSCNISNIKEINDIVKASYVKIMPLTGSLECEWKNKSPLHTLLKCLFQTAHNARNSKDVGALKFQFVRDDTFYDG